MTARAAKAAEVTRLITTAPSAESLLSMLEDEVDGPAFGHIQVGATVNQLAKLRDQLTGEVRCSPVYLAFVQRLGEAAERGELEVRQAANAFWAVVKMKEEAPEFLRVMPQLIELLDFYAPEMSPPDIYNVVWACAAHGLQGLSAERLLARVVERAVDRADELDSQGVANIIWASAKLGKEAPQLLDAMSVFMEVAEGNAENMNVQDIANILWAVGKLKLQGDFSVLIEVAVSRATSMNSQAVANILWAAGQLKLPPTLSQPLCRALASVAVERSMRFNAQEYGNACLGLGECAWRNDTVMQYLAAGIAKVCASWRGKDIFRTPPGVLCGFAKLGILDDDMMRALAKCTPPMLTQYNDWQLCAMAWSYDELDSAGEFAPLRKRLHAEIARRGIPPEKVPLSQAGPGEWFGRE